MSNVFQISVVCLCVCGWRWVGMYLSSRLFSTLLEYVMFSADSLCFRKLRNSLESSTESPLSYICNKQTQTYWITFFSFSQTAGGQLLKKTFQKWLTLKYVCIRWSVEDSLETRLLVSTSCWIHWITLSLSQSRSDRKHTTANTNPGKHEKLIRLCHISSILNSRDKNECCRLTGAHICLCWCLCKDKHTDHGHSHIYSTQHWL